MSGHRGGLYLEEKCYHFWKHCWKSKIDAIYFIFQSQPMGQIGVLANVLVAPGAFCLTPLS